jgi:predicted ATP-grasp superfamily ATP-dependent carboligase
MPDQEEIASDPSLLRDIASGTTAEERFDRLVAHFARLTGEVHGLKNSLAANTSLTKGVADQQVTMVENQAVMAENQQTIQAALGRIDFTVLADFLEAVSSMRGGIKVLGWLERPAKWIAAVGGAAVLLYSLWSRK